MLRRRDFLLAGSLAPAAFSMPSLLPYQNRGALAQAEWPDFRRQYSGFRPRITVGNSTGAALDMSEYINLVIGIPAFLFESFVAAVSHFTSGVITTTSRDYIDFRYESAERDTRRTRLEVANDIAEDRTVTNTLTRAMHAQLNFGEAAIANESLQLSVMREMLWTMREQIELLRMEYDRTSKCDGIYLVTERGIGLSGFDETERLRAEIERLRAENGELRSQNKRLQDFALKHG